MNYWLIFAIAFAAMVAALVLAYVLKSRLSDDDVWEELVDPNAPGEQVEAEGPPIGEIPVPVPKESEELAQHLKVEPMTIPTSSQSSRSFRGADLRRSSRLEQPIPLVVMGMNRRGETFQEKTSVLSFNLHGCRYSSRHDYPTDGWVTLQVNGTEGMNAPAVRARVRSVVLPKSPRELSQVGVEFEAPANVWGVDDAPTDWERVLGAQKSAGRVSASAAAPALTPTPVAAAADRKAEVTVFPSPAAPPPEPPTSAAPPKADRLVLTPDQLLQALQGKLQQAADRAVQTAISTHLHESVRTALGKIDDAWKSTVRQAEEFSTAHLGEAQNRWERELVVYRSRAEEVSRRLEGLAAAAQQNLLESQKLAQLIKTETEPQLQARMKESLERAKSEFAANVAEVSGQHIAQVSDTTQSLTREARARLDDTIAEMRVLLNTAGPATRPAGISEQQFEEATSATRREVLQRVEDRLAEIWMLFEQDQDATRQRTDQLAASIGQLGDRLESAKAGTVTPLSQQQIEPHLQAAKEQLHSDFEWRLGEVSGKFEQLHATARKNNDVLADRLDALTAESRSLRAQHEQGLAELRSALAGLPAPFSQERIDWLLNSTREQLLNHIEWRIGELASRFEQQHDVTRQQAEEMAQRLETLTANTRAELDQARELAITAPVPQRRGDWSAVEQNLERATREFENAAARVADRQLIRLNEQKQALANQTTLELEARATEARAILQKTANDLLEEFRRRVEVQMDLIGADATERINSSLASLDAENRAAIEARRRFLESEVGRAAEQSTAEFRSGIKAFLYSCLVAAVSAVDQHAQTTLAGLEKDGVPPAPPVLEVPGNGAAKPDHLSSAANTSDSK